MVCEQEVLKANGDKGLLTCTIRPSAIFGPGDRQLIPGMLEVCERGQHRFQIGNNQSLMDFTYVGNVAYAHVLAAEKLAVPNSGAAGQAFNLTNGTPVPFWDFASKVWTENGYYMPNNKKIVLSYNASLVIALISETIFSIKELFWDRSQLKEGLSRSRIKQAMSSRYFNITKAKTILGYEPQVGLDEGIKLSVAVSVYSFLLPLANVLTVLFIHSITKQTNPKNKIKIHCNNKKINNPCIFFNYVRASTLNIPDVSDTCVMVNCPEKGDRLKADYPVI